jgi:putative intracellular protease/amidase
MSTSITKPVLFVLTSHGIKGNTGAPTGYFLAEVTHPFAEMQAGGLAVEFASILGGEPPVDGMDLDDPVNARYWQDPVFRAQISNTLRLADVDASKYAAIFFAGGHGAMWDFPVDAAVRSVTRSIYEAGGVVGAVCHGPAALVNVTLSDGTYFVSANRSQLSRTARNVPCSWRRLFPSCSPALWWSVVQSTMRLRTGLLRWLWMIVWSQVRTRNRPAALALRCADCSQRD